MTQETRFQHQKITVPVYYHFRCDKDITPKIYSLPKIRKESVLLRPIVSFIGSPLYNLSKFLVDILSLIVNWDFCVKNSSHFIDKISRVKLNPDECMLSYDVVSLSRQYQLIRLKFFVLIRCQKIVIYATVLN